MTKKPLVVLALIAMIAGFSSCSKASTDKAPGVTIIQKKWFTEKGFFEGALEELPAIYIVKGVVKNTGKIDVFSVVAEALIMDKNGTPFTWESLHSMEKSTKGSFVIAELPSGKEAEFAIQIDLSQAYYRDSAKRDKLLRAIQSEGVRSVKIASYEAR